jgi:tight adherence protein C
LLERILLLIFAFAALFTYLLMQPSPERRKILQRVRDVREYNTEPQKTEDTILNEPFRERIIKPLFDNIGKKIYFFTPSGMKRQIIDKLNQAGNPVGAFEFVGYKVLCALLMAAVYTCIMFLGQPRGTQILSMLFFTVLSALLAFMLPEFWLSTLVTKRTKDIEKDLPDAMDMLTVSVEAGLGFDGAIQKVSENFKNPIAGELKEYLKEIRLGYARADALRNLSLRTKIADLQAFVAAIIQADQLGVGISKVLRIQAEQMRVKRKQRAQERAMQLPVKIIFPLVLFIFPAIFAVLLGPVVIHLLGFFK